MKRLPLIAALTLAGISSATHAADLMGAWQAAQTRDPEIAAARALHEQATFRLEQAKALWAPTVSAGGAVGVGGADSRTKGAEVSYPLLRSQASNLNFSVGYDAKKYENFDINGLASRYQTRASSVTLSGNHIDTRSNKLFNTLFCAITHTNSCCNTKLTL